MTVGNTLLLGETSLTNEMGAISAAAAAVHYDAASCSDEMCICAKDTQQLLSPKTTDITHHHHQSTQRQITTHITFLPSAAIAGEMNRKAYSSRFI